LTSPGGDLFSAAYIDSFSPTNLCNNYLADSGDSTLDAVAYNGQRTYSFSVAANAVFVVTVNGIYGSGGSYELSVTGGSCQPKLNINPAGAGHVALSWTTAAGGYQLESTNRLGAPAPVWPSVANPPVVVGGKFVVTNSIATNQFYRLRKPQSF
jgi:hypothetical protein